MNQSRMDSVMEALTNIVIGLMVSTPANYIWFTVLHDQPMSVAFNVATSFFFTIISFVRSYGLRRAFNGRSVWTALKDKFNGISHQADPDEGLDALYRRTSASGVPLVRMDADAAPRKRKRQYYFHGIRDHYAPRADR